MTKSAFTKDEIRQELERRKKIGTDREPAAKEAVEGRFNSVCMLCNNGFFSYDVSAEYPICDYCLHKD